MPHQQNFQPITINPLGAYAQGVQFRQQRQQAERANALAAYEADNTEALMSGDRNAWAGYARAGGGIGNALAGMKAAQPAPVDPGEQFELTKKFASMLGEVQDGDVNGYQRLEDFALSNRLITPEQAQQYDISMLPELRAMAVEFLKPTADIQNYEYGQRNPGFNDWRKTDAKPVGPSSDIAKLRADLNAGFITKEDFEARANKMLAPSGQRISFDENNNPVIETGGAVGGGFGRKVSNELEGKYAESYDLHSRLDRVGEIAGIDPASGRMAPDAARMLTYKGQAEDWIATQAEKLGVEPSEVERQAIEKRARFTTSVEQLFNAYRKEITGAAAAVQELERLKKSFINMDMSPTQFEAAYSEYRRELQRAMRISAKLRREGINPASKEGGDIMDRLYLGGADDTPADRFGELAASGMDEEAIFEKLRSEGY